jgi:hypothetical protein
VTEAPGEHTEKPKETIPAEYNSRTKLTCEVKAGEKNEHNFDLK